MAKLEFLKQMAIKIDQVISLKNSINTFSSISDFYYSLKKLLLYY